MEKNVGAQWDERFSNEEYVYGTEPNDFLRERAPTFPEGASILSLGEGEGRNAAFLAGLGHRVTAVDASAVGLAKAKTLAESRGRSIETVHADLSAFAIEPARWDVVHAIFCHLPAPLRRQVHRAAVAGLKPGGRLVLEAYTPAQLGFRTGGPPVRELLYTLDELREDFAGLDLEVAREIEREVVEGRLHHGRAAVVQIAGRKPGV
ncbi:class I SAM-dependent methyltransferase [Vulgatibacter sp.]|uniref:class I SAM-dependent methyltransferase n=1 Tax=Vulgatibacter sp. TaxID=1971226 RepID=UPI003567A75B